MKKPRVLELPSEEVAQITVEPVTLPVEEVEARPEEVIMRQDMPLAQAGRLVLWRQFKKLYKKRKLLLKEISNPEKVHQLRVATRRLRTGLKVLEEAGYHPDKTAYFRRGLAELAKSVGKARDSDVFLAHLEQYISTLPGEKLVGLESFKKLVLLRQEASREALLTTLKRKRTSRLLAELKGFLETPAQPSDLAALSDKLTCIKPVLVRHFSGSIIWKRYEQVLAFEMAEPFKDQPEVLHHLRLKCKRLRYTLEFFKEALPTGAADLIEQLRQVQDQLGAIQDQQVATNWIKQLLNDKQADNQVLQQYLDFRQSESEGFLKSFENNWRSLSQSQFRQDLARLLTA